MSLSALTILAAESHGEPAVSPYLIGALALGILLGLLLVTHAVWLGVVIASALLVLKTVSLVRLGRIGLPVPAR